MTKLAGYHWPPGDLGTGGLPEGSYEQWASIQAQQAHNFAKLAPGRHTAVCAGANVGIMPIVYAGYFKCVLAFEPDPLNWECLLRNVNDRGLQNVTCAQAALGRSYGRSWIQHNTRNSGASYVTCEKTNVEVEVMPLDHLHLEALDLLQLDVEGFEYNALEGALYVIRQHRPTIVLEINECAARYNSSRAKIESLLHPLGYSLDLRLHNDYVYTYKEPI